MYTIKHYTVSNTAIEHTTFWGALMSTFKIDKKTTVGNFILDEQHQHFISLIDNLSDTDDPISQSLIDELFSYIKYHFSAEEKMLQDVNYPDLHEHIVQHGKFVNYVVLMTDKLKDKSLKASEVRSRLIEWFVDHICIEDMKFKEYIKNY